MNSTSMSRSIRNIENFYGFNMSECSNRFMDTLTRPVSGNPVIGTLKDLMFDNNRFDIENMSSEEINHLRYLVLSTNEVLKVVYNKAKCVYYKPTNARLRFLMSYEDFYQTCIDKLMLNNGILRFDASYKFEPAIQLWFERVASWKCKHRAKTADEVTILDRPCNEDDDTTIGDLYLKSDACNLDSLKTEIDRRINRLLGYMKKTPSNLFEIKVGNTFVPLSEYNLARLFIQCLGKKELSKMIYNKNSGKLISNQLFNKCYKETLTHLSKLISNEYKEVGEKFYFNPDEL